MVDTSTWDSSPPSKTLRQLAWKQRNVSMVISPLKSAGLDENISRDDGSASSPVLLFLFSVYDSAGGN
jgi:hypothetical protein